MRDLKEYTIPFIGLKLGEHHFDFIVTNKFFEHFEYDEFIDADIKLDVFLNKKTTLLEFTLDFKGNVGVHCDVTNEPFQQPIQGNYHFIVKFGDEFNDENEDLLIIPHGSYEVNIQQFVYESIILNLPTRRIHPGIEDGTLKSDILDKLEELSPKAQKEDTETREGTDPRWDSLKKLLNDK
ncbi:MAG: YceD family protein [Patiriisocius sp.]|uniref:YceD family protein n=1 Tax=Patiriisocius sp. TaxID=2822396 RepID=UPI003EF81CB2